jgi:hypothetical protein
LGRSTWWEGEGGEVAVFAAAASEVGSDLGGERETRGRERGEELVCEREKGGAADARGARGSRLADPKES